MALTVANLRKAYGRDLLQRLRPKLQFAQLTNTNFRELAQGHYTVDMQSPDDPASGAGQIDSTTTEESRNPNWGTSLSIGDQKTTFTMDQGSKRSYGLGVDDINEASFDMVQVANERIARSLAYEIDQNLAAAFIAGVPSANTVAMGTNANFINTSGSASNAAARAFIPQMFREAAVWALTANIWKVGLIEHELFCIMPSYVWGAILHWIEADKPSDSLVNRFVGPRSELGVTPQGTADQQASIQVFLTNTMPTHTSGGKVSGQILFGTREAMTFGARPVHYQIGENPVANGNAIGVSVGGFVRYGRLVVNPLQLRLVRIRQTA